MEYFLRECKCKLPYCTLRIKILKCDCRDVWLVYQKDDTIHQNDEDINQENHDTGIHVLCNLQIFSEIFSEKYNLSI